MANHTDTLHTLPLDSLVDQCAQQTALYHLGRESDTSFCFEIFRRAILLMDQAAWNSIHQQYHEQIVRWVRRHPSFSLTGEDEEYFVNEALGKLWQAIKPERFSNFSDLKHLLAYLHLCVGSVITDYMRARNEAGLLVDMAQANDVPEPVSVEDCAFDKSEAMALWLKVTERLRDGLEVQVAYDSFVLGLKPADMMERSPHRYESTRQIYRIKENILERLHRDQEFWVMFEQAG